MSFFRELWSESWFRVCVALLLIAFLAVGIYSNTFYNQFVFDDFLFLTSEAYAAYDLPKFLSLWYPGKQRMVGFLTFALNYAVHGEDVFGYHVVNLVIHIINGWLVYGLVLTLYATRVLRETDSYKHKEWLALAIALVFVTHPVQTQAVTYIIQRFASLATTFYLAAVIFYIRSRLATVFWKQSLSFVGVGVCALLGLFTKEMVASLPLTLVLVELFWLRNFSKKLLIPIVLGGLVVGGIVGQLVYKNSQYAFMTKETPLGEQITAGIYAWTQPRVLMVYQRVLWVPTRLNVDYYFPVSTQWSDLRVWLSLGGLLGMVMLAVFLYRYERMMSFGIGWWLLTLSVESSIISLEDVIAEHRLYLPMFGFAVFLVFGLYKIYMWLTKKISGDSFQYTAWFFMVPILMYGYLTFDRNKDWKNDLTLWEDTVTKSDQKARPHLNLGTAYQSRGRLREAEYQYQQVIALGPPDASVYNNLAVLAAQRGDEELALTYFDKALELDSRIPNIQENKDKVQKRLEEKKRK